MRYSVAAGRSLFSAIARDQRARPARAILVDARAVTGPMTVTQRFLLGVHVAALRLRVPLALVAAPDLIDPGRFGQLVARSRGLDTRTFSDFDEAAAWLEGRVGEKR